MDPYQQNPGTPQGNPYEFILNPEKPQKNRGVKNNKLVMLLIFGVGGVILFMVLTVLLLNAFAPKKTDKATILSLAQTQQELIRISDQGSREARQQVTKNLATTIQYSLITQQKKTIELLEKNGGKAGPKELALKQNAATDQQFTSAKATSTYDTTFTKITEDELNAYATSLKALVDKATTVQERDMMSDFYKQTQQLISQIPYTKTGIQAAGQ